MSNQSDRTYEELRQRLLAFSIQPGARIKEVVWARELGVNRGDIRVALARLRAEGLVVKAARGYFAREYNGAYAKVLNEARLVLESAAAKLAVQRVTPEDIGELQTIADQMQLMAENGYRMGCAEADVRFHATLAKAAHNDKLVEIHRHANIPLTLCLTPPDSPEAVRRQLLSDAGEHVQILQALKDRDLSSLVGTIERGMR